MIKYVHKIKLNFIYIRYWFICSSYHFVIFKVGREIKSSSDMLWYKDLAEELFEGLFKLIIHSAVPIFSYLGENVLFRVIKGHDLCER